jgi:hypothetical protein
MSSAYPIVHHGFSTADFEPLRMSIPEPVNELASTEIAAGVVSMDRVRASGRCFRLARPIDVFVYAGSGGAAIEHLRLGITAHGESLAAAEGAFAAEFAALWDAVALADDAELTQDARRLKAVLRSLVAAVEP